MTQERTPQEQGDSSAAPQRRFDLYAAMGRERPAEDPNASDPVRSRPFSAALNTRLSKPINIDAGESIFSPDVISRYFDDPSVPDRDKETIATALRPSLMTSVFDDAIRQSVGEPVRGKGLLARAVNTTTDIAGHAVSKTLGALSWPSEKAEQAFGFVLSFEYENDLSDLSLSERWQLGKLTYEAYKDTGWWKWRGDEKLNEWGQQLATGEKTMDELLEEHEGGTADLVGKLILDPLWLLGGFPAVPGKLFKAGEKGAEVYKTGMAAGFFKGLSEGIRLEQFGDTGLKATQALRKVPVVGRPLVKAAEFALGAFVPSEQRVYDRALAEWRQALDEEDVNTVITSWRNVKGLFELTPQARSDAVYQHLANVVTQGSATQQDVIQLARAIEAGDVTLVPEAFGTGFRTKMGRVLFEALREMGVDLRKVPSMERAIAPTSEAWDAMPADIQKTWHRNAAAFLNSLHQDIHQMIYPALQRWHGVEGVFKKVTLKSGEVVEKFYPEHSLMQKFTNGMKFWLSTTVLNRPGFAALNYANNGATLGFDWGFMRGGKFWLDPFGRRGAFARDIRDKLIEDGLLDPTSDDPLLAIKNIVADRSVARELLFGELEDKTLGIKNKWWAPMVALSAKLDMGARLHAFYEMYGRARNATWKFEGTARGLVPDVPPALAERLGPKLTQRLRGAILAAGPNAERLRAIVDDIAQHGRPPLTTEHFLEKLADEMNLADDARQAFMDTFEPAFRTRLSAILDAAGNSLDNLRSRLDRLRGALRQQEHQARELDHLMPRARDYRNLPTAMADHEALMGERDKVLLIQLRRYMVAAGTPNADRVLEYFAHWQSTARNRRYVLQYAQQLIDISPANLESDIMFQLVPEGLRAEVKDLHSELLAKVDGLDLSESLDEIMATLSEKWINYGRDTVAELVPVIDEADQGAAGPLNDFLQHIIETEGRVAQMRDRLFRRVMETGTSAADDGAPDIDNVVDDLLGPRPELTDEELDALDPDNNIVDAMMVEMDLSRDDAIRELNRLGIPLDTSPSFLYDLRAAFDEGRSSGDEDLIDELMDAMSSARGGGRERTQNEIEHIESLWMHHYRMLDNLYNDALQRESEIFGFEHRFAPNAVGGDNPTIGEMLGVRNSTYDQLLDYVERNFAGDIDDTFFQGGTDELLAYLDDVAALAPDARRAITMIARGASDFTMLNYDNRYGIDHWMALVYPYSFWPTRSMWHWAQRGMSRPGAVAATAKLYDLIGDINSDVEVELPGGQKAKIGLPERFRNSIRIPIPFLDKSLQGGPLYFDPIKVLFPTADWSYDDNFDQVEGKDGTFLGVPRNIYAQVNQWAKVVGPGVNPFIDTALQYAGGDERALYLKYRFSSMPFMIPGSRQLQAMWSFTQAGEDPDDILDDDTKEALALGQHLPENQLMQILGKDDDEFDLYRTQRVLANMVGSYMKEGHTIEQRKAFVNLALEAMFTRKGKLWNSARKAGRKEGGLSVVTGWLFGMPIRQYPSGEDTSRGIQELYRQVQEDSRAGGGGDMTASFTEMFPEVEVRDAALAIFDGTDKQDQEIAGTLFAQNLDRVHGKYDQRIADLNGMLDGLARQGALKTEEGRRAFDVLETERNAITQTRSLEIDDLDKRFNARNQDPSLSRTPRTRAMQELETAYYALELPDDPSTLDFQKQQAQQQAFLEKLPVEQSYSTVVEAVRHYTQTRRYDREITTAFDQGDRGKAEKLIEERQQFVKDRTAEIKPMITRKEFQQYLNRNKRVPTSEELERDMASDQISEYFAIKDRGTEIGYTSRETAAIARSYWESHPLLEKYYGGDLPFTVDSVEDVVAYDRMEKIWDQFYSLEGGSQSRIDYLAMTLDELNGLRRRFGLKPVRITDPYWDTEAPPPRYQGSNPSGY